MGLIDEALEKCELFEKLEEPDLSNRAFAISGTHFGPAVILFAIFV